MTVDDVQTDAFEFWQPNVDYSFDHALGTGLKIHHRALKTGEMITIGVVYRSTNETLTLSWLTPEQTAGKEHPYVYTQNEPIYGRSMMPAQDTPAVKSRYLFSFNVQNPLTVFATGNKTQEIQPAYPANSTTFYYQSDILLPSYLVSFAAGNIK